MNLIGHLKTFTTQLTVAERVDVILTATMILGCVGLLVLTAFLVRGVFPFKQAVAPPTPLVRWGYRLVAIAAASLTVATLVGLFWLSYVTYLDASVAPADAYDIQVLSERGVLSFIYPTGKVSRDELVVAAGKPIRLIFASKDIPRGVHIPQLRLQQLAIPGRYTTLWFKVPTPASSRLRCTEGCPALAQEPVLKAVSDTQFESWLSGGNKLASTNTGGK